MPKRPSPISGFGEAAAPRAPYLLSCIIPVYNGEAHLGEAADSVTAQTLGFAANIQLIFVDDGSTDGTGRICEGYRERYPRNVVCVTHGRNAGVSAARNSGLRAASGEYVAFLDADDLLAPAMLKTGADALGRAREVDVAAFPTRLFGSAAKDRRLSLAFVFEKTRVIDLEKEPHCVPFGVRAVFRREALKEHAFDERLRFSEDAAFMHGVLTEKLKYLALNAPAYLYRTEAGGASAMGRRAESPFFFEKCRIFGELLAACSERTRGEITAYTQHLIVHEQLCNLTEKAPETPPSPETLAAALAGVKASLRRAEDCVIDSSKTPPPWFKCFLLCLKRGKTRLAYEEGRPVFYTEPEAREARVRISAAREDDGIVRVLARYGGLLREDASLIAICRGRRFAAERAAVQREIFFLGCRVYEEYAFTLRVPLRMFSGGEGLSFVLRTRTGESTVSACRERRAARGDMKETALETEGEVMP